MATYNLERGFTLTRMLDAPPDVVWQAWTEPQYLDWFFNPDTTPTRPTSVDLRVGGPGGSIWWRMPSGTT